MLSLPNKTLSETLYVIIMLVTDFGDMGDSFSTLTQDQRNKRMGHLKLLHSEYHQSYEVLISYLVRSIFTGAVLNDPSLYSK